MGAAADAAKSNSKFLKLNKGEVAVLEFLSYEVVPSNLDPEKKGILVKLRNLKDETKYWSTTNTGIMMFFDDLARGTLVEIKRDRWLDKTGVEDESKSAWIVQLAPQS